MDLLLISSAEGGSPVANLSANSTIATTVSSIGELMVSDSSATSALPSSDREPAAKKQKLSAGREAGDEKKQKM